MLLDRLYVRAFRGISREIELDLNASLTLIHAPNGTGKTSLCDAVEWIFTGEVARLKEALNKKQDKGIQNIFMNGEAPFVECDLQIKNQNLKIRREGLSDANLIKQFNGKTWEEHSLDDLLGLLTPESLPTSAKGLQRLNNRRSWVRGVRFLESPAADLLLDSTTEGKEVRELLFSDLLGVGELQRQERDLARIMKALNSKSRLEKDKREINNEIIKITREIQEAVAESTEPLIKLFKTQIMSAARHLGINLFEVDNLEEQYTFIQNSYEVLKEKLTEKYNIHILINKDYNLYKNFEEELTLLTKQKQDLLTQIEQLRTDITKNKDLFKELDALAIQKEANVKTLEAIPINSIKATSEVYLKQLTEFGVDINQQIDLTAAEIKLTQLQEQQLKVNNRINQLAQIENKLPSWKEAQTIKKISIEKLTQIEIPTPEKYIETEHLLLETKTALTNTELEFKKITGPLEQLRTAGRNFLVDAEMEHSCPLCSHDYIYHNELKKAIEVGLNTIPLAIEAITKQKHELERRTLELNQKLNFWKEAKTKSESTRIDLDSSNRKLSEAASMISLVGLEFSDLDNIEFQQSLSNLKETLNNEKEKIELLMNNQKELIQCSRKILNLNSEIEDNYKYLHSIKPEEIEIPNIKSQPPIITLQIVANFIETVQKTYSQIQIEATEARKKVEETNKSFLGANTLLGELTSSLNEILKKIGNLDTQRKEYLRSWEIISKEPLNDESLDKIPINLQKESNELTNAKQEIESASKFLTLINEAKSHERENLNRENQRTRLNARLREIETELKIIDECKQGIDLLRNEKENFVKQQIQPLCDIITALYVRAQSNYFINRIESSNDGAPLRWIARVGEFSLDDTIQMSLGQRQDLALAIFLARARQIGGTFFLDEPLLHLDDLNRVALLDILRTIVVENHLTPIRIIITTANNALVRHCREKFALVGENKPILRVYRLLGDPQTGIEAIED
jgi:exonuclease SbcC